MTLVSLPRGYFQLDLPDKIPAGQAAECNLKVNPEYLKNSFEKSLTLEFNDASKSRFSIPVVRRLIGQKKTSKPATPADKAKAAGVLKKSGE